MTTAATRTATAFGRTVRFTRNAWDEVVVEVTDAETVTYDAEDFLARTEGISLRAVDGKAVAVPLVEVMHAQDWLRSL